MAERPKLLGESLDFQRLFNFHIAQGTAAPGVLPLDQTSWDTTGLAQACGVQPATIYNWGTGRAYPTPSNFSRLRKVFFGTEFDSSAEAIELMRLYQNYSPYWIYVPNSGEEASAIQQVPAAFRFSINNAKIDVLSERPETIDDSTAADLYVELNQKLTEFVEGLHGSNIDRRVRLSAERMLQGLGGAFEDVRPGVVLSRMRSMEAIRDAFSTDEGREALFPGAVAAIDDICLSGRDLLSVFPIVREIERQRLALGIERSPEAISDLHVQVEAIQQVASDSDLVAQSASNALSENDVGILQAESTDQEADLLADKLLIIRNFASESVRWMVEGGVKLIDDTWQVIKPEFQEGMKAAAKIAPPLTIIALITSIAGPIAGLAALLHGDIFRPVSNAIKKILAKEPP